MSVAVKVLFLLTTSLCSWANPIGTIGAVTRQETIQKLKSGSELVALYSEPAYVDPIYVLSLHGTSFQQGFDAGYLFGKQIITNFNNLFLSLFGDIPIEPVLQKVTEAFLDWQWDDYLSKQVPQEYMDELDGLKAGGIANGQVYPDLSKVSSRGVTLANLPGDVEDIVYLLIDEFKNVTRLTPEEEAVLPKLKYMLTHHGHQCSMFGAWGDRTQDGNLYSARNLDWLTDLGINQYKLLTVHHPPSGYSHVTIGFAGIWGAMAGMSSQGLTVHEANLEESSVTYKGFPWILRLRHIMAYAQNLDEAMAIWKSTNNTVGFNFMIGSANDKRSRCMETQKDYTAYFDDMDSRENGAIDPGTGEVYGYTLANAVYRTNHGYDPVSQSNYQWYTYHAYEDSKRRYKTIYDSFSAYEASGVKIGVAEAVTVTSAIAIKGDGTDENNCNPDLYLKGENILSVTYDPTERTIYAAWEDGTGDAWVPAGCNGYIKIDMKQWF